MPGLPVLAISDGTTTINLIDPRNGFLLKDWMPARPVMNQTRRNSVFAGGSAVRMYTYGDVIDTFTVAARNVEQNTLIANCQELDRLLTKAVDYWATNWATAPVWIEARGANETNTRYAIIKSYQVAGEGNPYSQPFWGLLCLAGHGEMTIAVEHGIWQSVVPSAIYGTLTPITAQNVYNGVTYGRGSVGAVIGNMTEEFFVANKHNQANITHVYSYDSSVPSFSANLIGAAKPVALFPAVIGNSDMLYVGCDTAVADSGPFNNLVFDISPLAVYVATATMVVEYYNGGWVGLTTVDLTGNGVATKPFSFAYMSMSFVSPADWTATAINGITCYWIRYRCVLAGGDAISTPSQRNRDIYTCTWPYIDIAADSPQGDMPALACVRVLAMSDKALAYTIEGEINRVLVGLRSLGRGASFTPYINWADEQNNASLTITCTAGGNTAFATATETPSGRKALYSVAGVEAMQDEISVSFGALAMQYMGKYHAYLRYRCTAGAAGDIKARLRIVNAPSSFIYTATVDLAVSSHWDSADLGVITLPTFGFSPSDVWGTFIYLQLQNTAAAARTADLMDLVLMPIDEWFCDVKENMEATPSVGYPLTYARPLQLDGITFHRQGMVAAQMYGYATNHWDMAVSWPFYSAGPPILQANAAQRLWFFFQNSHGGTVLPRYAPPYLLSSILVWHTQRYQSMRGAR